MTKEQQKYIDEHLKLIDEQKEKAKIYNDFIIDFKHLFASAEKVFLSQQESEDFKRNCKILKLVCSNARVSIDSLEDIIPKFPE